MALMQNKETERLLHQIDAQMKLGYEMWDTYQCPPLTTSEKEQIPTVAADSCKNGIFQMEYSMACQNFYLFRKLHQYVETEPETATLLGDYFFSQFSHNLIPIDSTRLIDLFSEYLKKDTKEAADGRVVFQMEAYLEFIKDAADEVAL